MSSSIVKRTHSSCSFDCGGRVSHVTHLQSEWVLHSTPQLLSELVLFAIVCVVCVDDPGPISVPSPRGLGALAASSVVLAQLRLMKITRDN